MERRGGSQEKARLAAAVVGTKILEAGRYRPVARLRDGGICLVNISASGLTKCPDEGIGAETGGVEGGAGSSHWLRKELETRIDDR